VLHTVGGRKLWGWLWVLAAALVAVAALGTVLATAHTAYAVSSDHGASFAVRCDFSHRLSDDPIVYHDQPGAAHSHDFFGNTTTNAYSTYQTMTTGIDPHDPPPTPPPLTTCSRDEDTAAYWMPTLSWDGVVRDANRAVFYYRAGGKNYTKVKPFPDGLKVITGAPAHISWRCGRADNGKGKRTPPTQCDSKELGLRIIFPDCSNRQDDSDDHRSHMVYSRMIDGKVRCPRSHPIPVPSLTMNVTFPIPDTPGQVTLSSDHDEPGGSTMHADFFNAWDKAELQRLVTHCINNVPPSKPRPADCQANPPSA
jgi:hypothetical protein